MSDLAPAQDMGFSFWFTNKGRAATAKQVLADFVVPESDHECVREMARDVWRKKWHRGEEESRQLCAAVVGHTVEAISALLFLLLPGDRDGDDTDPAADLPEAVLEEG